LLRQRRFNRIRLPLLAAALLLLTAVVVVVAVVLLLRGRAALSELGDQLAELERLEDVGETVVEMSGESARSAIAEQLQFSLPESATNVFFARQGAVRPAYWLRFSLAEQDVSAFLAQTCLETAVEGDIPYFQYAVAPHILVNLTWWQPEDAVNPAGGRCVWRPGVELRLQLDRADRETQTIYIELMGEMEDGTG